MLKTIGPKLAEPATRAELIAEVIRLNALVKNAIASLARFNLAEADILRIAFMRRIDEPQPDVGRIKDGPHFYDNPRNAGREKP